jgi:hypothetical protein
VEDLVSNLIGFYRAIYPGVDYVGMCEPVSKEQALAVWDKYGPVGQYKNNYPNPILFPSGKFSTHGPMTTVLPPFLNNIIPAVSGTKFKRVK